MGEPVYFNLGFRTIRSWLLYFVNGMLFQDRGRHAQRHLIDGLTLALLHTAL
jgi:hypothetical protein